MTHPIPRLALVALLVVACRSGDDAKRPADSAALASSATPGAVTPRDACSLITKAEADAIIGGSVTPQPRPVSGSRSTCDYVPTAGGPSYQGFTLEVYWQDGQEAIAVGRKAAGNATDAAGGKGDSVATDVMALRRIGGLGDEAYFSGRTMSYVRKGDVTLQFQLGGLDKPTPEQLRALANAALPRISG